MTSTRLLKCAFCLGLLVAVALPLLTATGCAIYRNDRCYVEDLRYDLMRRTFMQSGSIEIVRQEMDRLEWARCEKNEVLYRISKEFEVPAE